MHINTLGCRAVQARDASIRGEAWTRRKVGSSFRSLKPHQRHEHPSWFTRRRWAQHLIFLLLFPGRPSLVIYIYIYTYMYRYKHINITIYIYIYIYLFTNESAGASSHSMQTTQDRGISTYTYTCLYSYIYIYICTYIHIERYRYRYRAAERLTHQTVKCSKRSWAQLFCLGRRPKDPGMPRTCTHNGAHAVAIYIHTHCIHIYIYIYICNTYIYIYIHIYIYISYTVRMV